MVLYLLIVFTCVSTVVMLYIGSESGYRVLKIRPTWSLFKKAVILVLLKSHIKSSLYSVQRNVYRGGLFRQMNSFLSTVDSRTTGEVIKLSMLELFKHSMASRLSFITAWRNIALSILKQIMEQNGRSVAQIRFAHLKIWQDTLQI